jgi:hypothetical protein
MISLELLDMKSTFDLFTWSLRRDFSYDELDSIDQSGVHEKIFAICGGMPDATAGLANSFCAQFKKEFHNLKEAKSVDLLKFTYTFLDDTPTDLQEIVCYRFDRMKPEEQMLLKICSVAGFDQYSFSQHLLESVLLATSQDEESFLAKDFDDLDNDSGFQLPSMVGLDVSNTGRLSEDSGYLNYMLQGDNFKEMLGK